MGFLDGIVTACECAFQAPAVSTATPAPAASHDEGWAAFLDASPAPASAAPPAAEAASPTDDHWDAFQVCL
jgi:hypothetical protein